TCEPGKKYVAPRARVDFRNLFHARDQNRQEHDEDENVFPKNDHLGIEQFVERNAPRAFRAPERSAKTDEPRAVGGALCSARLHRIGCSVGSLMRRRGSVVSLAENNSSLNSEARTRPHALVSCPRLFLHRVRRLTQTPLQ